jgi:hypothetical protein
VAAAERLRLCRRDADLVRAAVRLLGAPAVLEDAGVPGSHLYRALRDASGPALVLTWLLSASDVARGNLLRFAASLAGTKALVTGADLSAMGVPPGPAYGRAIDAVLDARLDGRIATRDEALALARTVLMRHAAGLEPEGPAAPTTGARQVQARPVTLGPPAETPAS